jgi:hypothetical protein
MRTGLGDSFGDFGTNHGFEVAQFFAELFCTASRQGYFLHRFCLSELGW